MTVSLAQDTSLVHTSLFLLGQLVNTVESRSRVVSEWAHNWNCCAGRPTISEITVLWHLPLPTQPQDETETRQRSAFKTPICSITWESKDSEKLMTLRTWHCCGVFILKPEFVHWQVGRIARIFSSPAWGSSLPAINCTALGSSQLKPPCKHDQTCQKTRDGLNQFY